MGRSLLIACLLILAPLSTYAETGFQFTVPGARAPDDPNVGGMRLSFFHGENQSMRGFDLGLISLSESADMSGVALIMGMHKLTRDMDGGAALSLINIHSGTDRGLNAAFINKLNNAEDAVNTAFVTIADGGTNVDIGGLNVSDHSNVQIGFLNVTKRITGIQIGFLNVAENGFLPVFPIFNFPGN